MKSRPFGLTITCTVLATALVAQHQVTRAGATLGDAAAAFLIFYDRVERMNSGAVTVAVMADAMNAKDGDPKTLARINSWDANQDGRIDRQEAAAKLETEIAGLVKEQMSADADGDGHLSLAEYALSVPDPQGDRTNGGLTKRQQLMFSSGDANGDKRYSREEVLAANAYRQYHSFIGRAAALRARVLDTDRDRKYNIEEFAAIFGVQPGQPVPPDVRDKFSSKSFGAGNHTYYNVMMRIVHFPMAEIKALEKRLDALASEPGSQSNSSPDVTPNPVTSLWKLFDALDLDADGKVPLRVLFDALAVHDAEARRVKSMRGLDVSGDGILTRAEVADGIRVQIAYQVNRVMNTDADGDAKVSPEEFALSVPDPEGKAGANGLTPLQERSFRLYDKNRDGIMTKQEVEALVDDSFESSFWGQWMALRARKADRNGDWALDESEFEFLEGAPLTDEARTNFRWAGAKDGRLPSSSVQALFFRIKLTERAAAERRLDEFEKRLAVANSTKGAEK